MATNKSCSVIFQFEEGLFVSFYYVRANFFDTFQEGAEGFKLKMKFPEKWLVGSVERLKQAFLKHYKIEYPTTQLTASSFVLKNAMYMSHNVQENIRLCSLTSRGRKLHRNALVASCIRHRDVIHVKCIKNRRPTSSGLLGSISCLKHCRSRFTEIEGLYFDGLWRRYSFHFRAARL
jgi:hypothetical protein